MTVLLVVLFLVLVFFGSFMVDKSYVLECEYSTVQRCGRALIHGECIACTETLEMRDLRENRER